MAEIDPHLTSLKRNVLLCENSLYFSLDTPEVLPVIRSIDEIVRKNGRELKVRSASLNLLHPQERPLICASNEPYNTLLAKYLDAIQTIQESNEPHGAILPLQSHQAAHYYGIGLVYSSSTVENLEEVVRWKALANCDDLPKLIAQHEMEYPFLKLDRTRSLEELEYTRNQLNTKLPDAFITSMMIAPLEGISACIGLIQFNILKPQTSNPLSTTKTQLIERLSSVDGPRLSLDVHELYKQIANLYAASPELFMHYGDILSAPNDWHKRLFRIA